MSMQVVEAKPWQQYADEGKTLLAQFGDYDVIRDGDQEPTSSEDYEMAKMAAYAPAMYALIQSVASDNGPRAVIARTLLEGIHRDG